MTEQVHIYRTLAPGVFFHRKKLIQLSNGAHSAIVSLMDEVRGERRHFRIIWEGKGDIPAFWWNTRGEFSCPKAFVKVEIF